MRENNFQATEKSHFTVINTVRGIFYLFYGYKYDTFFRIMFQQSFGFFFYNIFKSKKMILYSSGLVFLVPNVIRYQDKKTNQEKVYFLLNICLSIRYRNNLC